MYSFHDRSTSRDLRSRRSGAGGFSLVEMLIVVAVISVALGFTVMSIGSWQSTSMSASTRHFADFINLNRSRAIAQHTAIRVGIVVQSANELEKFRLYSAWGWNKRTKTFDQIDAWLSLPPDIIFEPSYPEYLRESQHAEADPASVRGHYVLDPEGASTMEVREKTVCFFEFSPSGRIKLGSTEHRNLMVAMRPGEVDSALETPNWSQFNVDTLTGRVRIYRP